MSENMFLVGFLAGTLFGGALTIKAMRPRRRRRASEEREFQAAPRVRQVQAARQPSTAQLSTTRSDVVAALQGLGFKKADAVLYTDACLPTERASVEDWTRNALRYAREG